MTVSAQKRVLLIVVFAINLLLWAIPSHVVELIARNRHVLLGRYSREHFTWILVVFIGSAAALYIGLGSPIRKKRRVFQVLALLLIGTPLIGLLDIAVTLADPKNRPDYVMDGLAYHRPPKIAEEEVFVDCPPAKRSYPGAADGYGRVDYTLTTDERGYRNRAGIEQADIVVLGDSFAEGSQVSDRQAWPVLLAERSGYSVYNLGMSGYDPQHYLASLRKYGLALKPKLVICMLYEGNDFRSAKWVENPDEQGVSAGKAVQFYIRHSRLLTTIDALMTNVLGGINADGELAGGEVVSWLPVRLGNGPRAAHYAFTAKRLVRHYVTQEEFREDKDWKTTARILDAMRESCEQAGAELLIVYAPDKPNLVLPLVADKLPTENVRGFSSLKLDDLPDAKEYMRNLLDRLDSEEVVTRDYCREHSVPFISTTGALRIRAADGDPVYYTYDQHWTPIGHEIVADLLASQLQGPLASLLTGPGEWPARPASSEIVAPD